MSAVVFCVACDKVMDITEYLHPSHECAAQTLAPRRALLTKQPKHINKGTDCNDT